jgi:hypothetical protein
MSMNSYTIRSEVNSQVILWTVAAAIYATAKGSQRLAAYLVSRAPALFVAMQVAVKVAVLVAVIVGAVACAAMYPAAIVGVFGVWVALMASKPK